MKLPAAAIAFAPFAADAHGPTRQKVVETVTIAAPPDAVWERIGQFGDMSWHAAVAATEAPDGNEIGAVRVLSLGAPDGPTITEELTKHSAEDRTFSYVITEVAVETLPVTNYSSTLSVSEAEGGGSLVEWRGAFDRGYPNNDPPPELNDEAAVAAVTGVYRAGLDALKTALGPTN